MRNGFSAVTALFIGAFIVATPTLAQAPAEAQPNAEQPQTQRLTREKFDAFISAAVAVIDIGRTWKPRIDAASTTEEADALKQSARAEMHQAIDDAPGITPQEYIGIARAARDNPDLAAVIHQQVRAAQQGRMSQEAPGRGAQ